MTITTLMFGISSLVIGFILLHALGISILMFQLFSSMDMTNAKKWLTDTNPYIDENLIIKEIKYQRLLALIGVLMGIVVTGLTIFLSIKTLMN